MRSFVGLAFEFFCLLMILVGLVFRFLWTDWSQGANLHPDEYGLTNTLTQLHLPKGLDEYFNTRLSPLSPYWRYDEQGQQIANGPDNGMRWGQWPMILIRAAGEASGNTGYDALRLMGRQLSALADTLALLLIYLIGKRLYNHWVGLLAAALSALAVMQIQQSHFMTVDNFGALFTMLTMYAAVRIAQQPPLSRRQPMANGGDILSYRPDGRALGWYALFGVAFGMTLTSKINLLPLGGMLLIAGWIGVADLRLRSRRDLLRILGVTASYMALAGVLAAFTFRVTQPMSFREATGDTHWYSLHPNPDWVQSMQAAQRESSGVGGGPPGEQWAHRIILVFPLVNMVVWGMGLPLGLAGWAGFGWAAWRAARGEWRRHLLPLVWTGGYTLFMGTRWVMSMRYFLPVYPFLCLMAAWGLLELWRRVGGAASQPGLAETRRRWTRGAAALAASAVVMMGTLAWATAFVNAIYRQDHTRIQAARWIFENIPAPFHLSLVGEDGQAFFQPVPAPDWVGMKGPITFVQSFTPTRGGRLDGVLIPHAAALGGAGRLRVVIAADEQGQTVIDQTELEVAATPVGGTADTPGPQAVGQFGGGQLEGGQVYFLIASAEGDRRITIRRSVISNENWDEGLPMPLDGWDPFGQLYRGVTMEARWYDNPQKLEMYLDVLAQADYVILPSQRAIWSSCRLPRTFPMTMEYYRALFDGRLGFDLAALFTSPLKLGALQISDVGGTLAWGQTPRLPLFNHSLMAAEEAFSVYDHPPVWVFRKRPDFNLETVRAALGTVDLSQVVVQSPREADGDWCPQE